ncbi:MAG: nitrilase-related carbon-nitrogen hydrolase, partial [Bdellovibrionota bacterium]
MLIKVAGAVLNQTPFDWSGNRSRIEAAIGKARADGVRLLCLPELCITGYGCEDAFFNPHVQLTALEILKALLPSTKGIAVTFGLPVSHKGVLFNCIAIVCDGKVVGVAPKKFLAGDGVHYEPRWFKAWPPEEVGQIELFGEDVPFGDLHFDFKGVKVGLEICEEAWVAQRPGAVLAKRGVDIILNPSASHFAFGKSIVRKGFVSEGSRAFNVAYVYTNLLGNESGRIIFDGGVLIADGGQIIAQGERFSFAEFGLTPAIVDVGRNRVVRSRTSSYQPDSTDSSHLCIEVPFELVPSTVPHKVPAVAAWENSSTVKEEEFTRAVSLGLFDFLRKSRQNGFVVSLSGGVDSAAVTV